LDPLSTADLCYGFRIFRFLKACCQLGVVAHIVIPAIQEAEVRESQTEASQANLVQNLKKLKD
jgi:hypothetical protein